MLHNLPDRMFNLRMAPLPRIAHVQGQIVGSHHADINAGGTRDVRDIAHGLGAFNLCDEQNRIIAPLIIGGRAFGLPVLFSAKDGHGRAPDALGRVFPKLTNCPASSAVSTWGTQMPSAPISRALAT